MNTQTHTCHKNNKQYHHHQSSKYNEYTNTKYWKKNEKKSKWRKESAQTLKNDHGSFLRALRRGFLAPSKKIIFFYYDIFESNYIINK